jgi:hypothetical protein
MTINPFLKKLGLSDSARAVIIHTDDIGMCQASVQAYADLWEFGTISSGAVMVPCPWFPATAKLCRENPGMDMGVHATLNCEWDLYRWGPLSTLDPDSGLLDTDGYLHQGHEAVYKNATPQAVSAELSAQVARAVAAGIDVTHIDSHMGTIMHPKFIQTYLAAGVQQRVPTMVPRPDAVGAEMMGLTADANKDYAPVVEQSESQGQLMLEGILAMPLDNGNLEENISIALKLLGNLPVGITHFILHPSVDTPELRTICPDWESRVANYKAFMSQTIKEFIHNSDIQVIGYRTIREAMRN